MNPVRLPEKIKDLKLVGADDYPFAYSVGDVVFGEAQSMEWPEDVITGKTHIAVGIIQGTNLAVTWPNSNRVKQALEKIDYLIVMDLFMTATGEMADMILPASSYLETTELCTSASRIANTPYAIMRKKVIEPLYESWPDWKLWFELAKKVGYEEYYPWKDMDEYLDYLLKPMQPLG